MSSPFIKRLNQAFERIWADPEIIPLIGVTIGTVLVASMHFSRKIRQQSRIDYNQKLEQVLKLPNPEKTKEKREE